MGCRGGAGRGTKGFSQREAGADYHIVNIVITFISLLSLLREVCVKGVCVCVATRQG